MVYYRRRDDAGNGRYDIMQITLNLDSEDLILSAAMFENTVYEVDMRKHRLNIDTKDNQPVRLLKLSNDNGKLSVYLAGTYENEKACRNFA